MQSYASMLTHILTRAHLQDEPSVEERITQPEISPSAPQSLRIITDEEDHERGFQQQEILAQVCKLFAPIGTFDS